MIVTVTPNPSLDRTIELDAELRRGAVQRAVGAQQEAGGKGVNVSRALVASEVDTLALLPGSDQDAVIVALRGSGIPHQTLPLDAPLRSNVTVTEPDGTTTKINEPGPTFSAAERDGLLQLCVDKARGASWLVLAGSLPPGIEPDFYATVIRAVRQAWGADAPRIAVDSSGIPLREAVTAGPDLLKPNAEELAELTGSSADLEADPALAAQTARGLIDDGVGAALVTLGAHGALLVTGEGSWLAQGPPIIARSTVGAGDSALAGYLYAHTQGEVPLDCLAQAVAHGAAATQLPGSTVPTLEQTAPQSITVTPLPSTPLATAATDSLKELS
ncbi:1-phosphofructokinase family hexose kinase [Psychromicrobium xiongbiense]|uniref:1-phosphofructokinase family hexose kinase n=1 Tax=Psychromicrobium xiongbiense TaxID=3051184 RepID=UPI00255594AD|nr:1-phosphofructokinase [Psychromicrobium sp. YIM S02556]